VDRGAVPGVVVSDRLLTVKDVAARLSLSERRVRQMLQAEELPSMKVGGVRRVDPAALDAYVDACRRSAGAS
jgi:excisionase family DNA binding protein